MPDSTTDLQHLADYDFTGRNEADIRGDWIEPLLRVLGYGLGTRHRILRELQLRLEPPVRMIASSRYEIDFLPTVFGHRLWVIEAKRPQEDLFGAEHLGQAWSYATDPRVAVPYIVLCDGARLGVFDVTVSDWTSPVFDGPKADIRTRFDDLHGIIGAPRIAEFTRRRQLQHLRTALEAQVDLTALDQTVEDVKRMVDEIRPDIVERRRDIRDEARKRVQEAGQAAVDKAGMWGHAQQINGNCFIFRSDIPRAVEIVREKPAIVRVREFDDIERSTTPTRETQTRMWFPLRVVRMAAAALLADDEDEANASYFRSAALTAASQHASAFQDDPLLAAVYRLQRLLGPLGWRMAALSKPALDKQATELEASLEAEEWLRLDGEFGMTGYDNYKRMAQLLPIMVQAQIRDWTVEGLAKVADDIEQRLAVLPKPPGFEQLQPIGDPWLDSWLTGNPVLDMSLLVIQDIEAASQPLVVRELLSEILQVLNA